MLPVARALSLSQGEVNDLVEKTEGDEEKQLRRITELWETKAENNELPQLCEFVASVPRQGESILQYLTITSLLLKVPYIYKS